MNYFYSGNNPELLACIYKLNGLTCELINFTDKDVIMEFVLEKRGQEDFHFSRGIGKEKCRTLVCRLCHSEKLRVGQASFFTAVKCDSCGYEIGIHEG